MKKIDDYNYLSDEGKVFSHITSNEIMGWGISFGVDDSIDNYIEIDCPEEYKGNQDYDNLIKRKHENRRVEPRKLRENNTEEK
jgi:hypothetical protein